MCGIVGRIGVPPLSVGHTRSALRHRGPDGDGWLDVALPWAAAGLEMTRLAIVDRREIAVPFDFRRSCGVVLAYNGEVYNWRELRAELSDGTPWETECDAEVIARGWRRWGPDVLSRMNGMWGLALLDVERGEFFLARDRAGEKPLYYAEHGGALHFASEIKALPVPFMERHCRELEVLEFDCLETTPFAGVKRLGPGQFIHFKSPADVAAPRPSTWWTLPTVESRRISWEETVSELQALIAVAVRARASADVPVGVLLSGGIDSAIVQAVARSERLYTVSFPWTALDATPDAACVRDAFTRHAAHRVVTFGRAELEEVLPRVAYHLDTPATWTAVCQWFVSQRMAADGVKVVLSGEGADELFAGYARYRILHHVDRMAADPVLGTYGPLRSHMMGSEKQILARMLDRSGGDAFHNALAIVDKFAPSAGSLVERMARIDFYTTMQVLLRMADRMTAAFGMENRSPFLDYRVMEFAASLPVEWKMHPGLGPKAIVREVARRLGVPSQITDATAKRGMAVPWAQWASTAAAGGARGAWDRGEFAAMMRTAWREAFFGGMRS